MFNLLTASKYMYSVCLKHFLYTSTQVIDLSEIHVHLQLTLIILNSKILEKREQAAVDHVKESVELVETALLEKEKVSRGINML